MYLSSLLVRELAVFDVIDDEHHIWHTLFRDDNSTLSKGKNGRYYFVFSLKEKRLEELPEELVRQASEIAKKVVKELCNG